MAEITPSLIKTLRNKTNAGMMDCKAALTEASGDLGEAETILRKKGIADAEKKAGRAAREGAIACRIVDDARTGILAEVNCETDFAANSDNFRAFVEEVLDHIVQNDDIDEVEELLDRSFAGDSSQTLRETIKAKVGELGENMELSRFVRFQLDRTGVVASYIHMQGSVGVLAEVTCGKDDTAANDDFRALARDLTMQIAAAQPICVARADMPAEAIEAERDVYREQMKDKPAEVIEKIIDGKIGKFYGTNCLLEQAFIKDGDKTIQDLVEEVEKSTGDEIAIGRFVRYAVGEESG